MTSVIETTLFSGFRPAATQEENSRVITTVRDAREKPDVDTPPSSENKIRIEGLRAWFGKTEAVKSISFPIAKNRVTAIIGP